ncbi:hypothetical protein D0C16_08180 [Cellvibrio sp. KY-GH-1]|uniref:hypothetical protein n=1 Tax=Cellvibrio sp. KY-GH-1 TaxID=2303332 RepID=UPI0012479153|nr:hypothetical protein [Cellvibrio sp. KY-GH-1]QEY15951.1 hypothetical protein D0C16_08180 [Cellvibrio sp. KY-GH-1]
MKSILRHRLYALIALSFWLMISWSGVHGHFCLDGNEPPVSFHIDVMDGHPVSKAGDADQDIDINQSQSLSTKPYQWDVLGPLLTVFLIVLSVGLPALSALPIPHPPIRHQPGLRPPLRAPPSIHA